jgi:hypothetical protein
VRERQAKDQNDGGEEHAPLRWRGAEEREVV